MSKQLRIEIPFWGKVAAREVNQTECRTVEELFAQWKIVPKWKSLDDVFFESLGQLSPQHNGKTLARLRTIFHGIPTYLNGLYAYIYEEQSEADLTPDKACEKIAEYVTDMSAEYRPLFPTPITFHFQNMYMALSDSDRTGWSERSWDNLIYSNCFHRYFRNQFPSDQSIKDHLPRRIANPDLSFIGDGSPFFVAEWGEEEHASNHKDLPKILETKREVLRKRADRYPDSTNYMYGMLCGGGKLALFRMEHDRKNNLYDCYFISKSKDDLYTTELTFQNIATILQINIILMIGGKLQRLGPAKRGPEKNSSVSSTTPAKIDDSSALRSKQTEKKRPMKKCLSANELHKRSKSPDDNPDNDSLSKDFVKKLAFGQADPNNATEGSKPTTTNSTQKSNNTNTKNTKEKTTNADANEDYHLKKQQVAKNCVGNFIQKYRIEEMITSLVYRVSYQSGYYVAKFCGTTKDITREEKILSELSDKFLKPVETLKLSDKLRCLIFPYVHPVGWSDCDDFVNRAFAIISAISELHEKNIAHSDIKYSNIICSRKATYLIDFDLALRMTESWNGKFNGTFGYRAPEAMHDGVLSLKMDIYSYGILLFELASSESIYDYPGIYDDDEEQMAAKVRKEVQIMGSETEWHARLVRLIDRCMIEDPEQRPTAKQIMADPFFAKVKKSPVKSKISHPRPVTKPLLNITNKWQANKIV